MICQKKSHFCPFYWTKTAKQHVLNKLYYGYYYGILMIVMRKEHGIRQQTMFFAIISFILNQGTATCRESLLSRSIHTAVGLVSENIFKWRHNDLLTRHRTCKNYNKCVKLYLICTRKVGRPPAGQFYTTCGELVAFGHLEGPLGPLDSCMESCIVRDHSC